MTDPAIRAALDAAGKAIADLHEETACNTSYPCSVTCSCRDDASAAIAAFLRALHDATPFGVIDTAAGEAYTADCARLAAAAEEAARDA